VVRWRARSSSAKFSTARALSLLPCKVSEREQRGEVDGPGRTRVLWYPCRATKPMLGVADDVRTPSRTRCLTMVGG
jgi:hypothetical protein